MLHTPVLHRVHRVAQRKTHFLAVSLCLWRVPNEKDKTFKKNKTESPLKLMARHASALFPHHQSPKGSYCERDPGAQWRTTCNIPHVNRYERHSKQNKHPNKVQRPIPEETHSSPAGYDKWNRNCTDNKVIGHFLLHAGTRCRIDDLKVIKACLPLLLTHHLQSMNYWSRTVSLSPLLSLVVLNHVPWCHAEAQLSLNHPLTSGGLYDM